MQPERNVIRVSDEEREKPDEVKEEVSEPAESDEAGREAEPGPDDPEESLLTQEIPPANFYALVTTFQIPAMQFLGELKDPSSEKVEVHPSLAKYYIDCLAILDEKTRGNLSEEESKILDSVLMQLRLSYVKVAPGGKPEGS